MNTNNQRAGRILTESDHGWSDRGSSSQPHAPGSLVGHPVPESLIALRSVRFDREAINDIRAF